jgi:hypothetical protein
MKGFFANMHGRRDGGRFPGWRADVRDDELGGAFRAALGADDRVADEAIPGDAAVRGWPDAVVGDNEDLPVVGRDIADVLSFAGCGHQRCLRLSASPGTLFR